MKSRFIFVLPFVILLWPWGLKALAQPESAVVLTDEQEQYPLGLHFELLEDKNQEWTFDDVTSPEIASLFMPSQEAAPGFGFTDSAYWVRFRVSNEASADVDWVLLYESTAFNIEAYFPSSSGEGYVVTKTGSALPFETRDIPVGQFAFRLPIAPGESGTIYLRFASEGSLILPLSILKDSTFGEQSLQQQVANGFLYGIILTLIIYNLVLFVVVKDRSYLFYVLFFSSLLLAVMALDGFAAQYLWPNLGYLAAAAIRFFFVIATIFALLFATSFLRTGEFAPRLHKVMIGLAMVNLAIAGLMFLWFRETALIQAMLLVIGCLIMIIAGVVVWREGYAPARYYLFGWSGVVLGFAILFLTLANLVPFSVATNFILRAGLIILALVVSFGLAARINLYRQESMEAQLAVSYQRAQIAQDLHDSVTQSLYSANLFAEAGRETLEIGDEQGASHYFSRIGQTTQQALKEMRLFLYELRPPDVVEAGLVDALQKRIDAVEKRSGMEARLLLDGSINFPSTVEDQFYRIAQEALNNVLKHAQADNVSVYLRSHDGAMGLEIVDDGQGFDLVEAESSGGMGLQTMQERAAKVGGRLSINTAPGQGTSVKVEVVGEAADGQEAVQQARELQPDVILMDMVMPGTSGLQAIQQLQRDNHPARILVLSSFAEDEQIFPAIKAGASGYLLKDSTPGQLVDAVRDVHRGQSSLHPTIARKLIGEIAASPADDEAPPEALTGREIAVLKLVAQGYSNQEIAQQLHISERTVGKHVSGILKKLHLANRTQAALYALREGLAALE